MDIESDLKRALRRESPPAGVAQRVIARIDAPLPRRAPWWRAVAAGLLLTVLGGGWLEHKEIERRAGEHARDEVMLALRITSSKVHSAQEHVREMGNH